MISGAAVRTTVRWALGLVVVMHGFIHVLGAAKGLGWAEVSQLRVPIGAGWAAWLAAAALTVAAGVLLLASVRWWWSVGGVAVVVSQIVIVTSWGDAKAGTIVNVALLGAVVYGWASQGSGSARADYRRRADRALAASGSTDLVTEADFAHLPDPIASYIRGSGAVGQRRVRALSLFTMVDASGPEMDRGETVTLFNDLCILAPAALIDAPVAWNVLDEQHVRGTYTYGVNTVTAELTFNDDHELVDFFSDDRTAVSSDGKTFTAQRWSTPITGYRTLGASSLGTIGEGHWHASDGEFAYLEYRLDDIIYNPADLDDLATEQHS